MRRRIARAERAVAFVPDEDIAGERVAKAGAAGAQAEIQLDAVVAAERIRIEAADGAQAVAPEIERTDRRRTGNCDRSARVGAREQRVERGDRVSRRAARSAVRGSGYVAMPTLLVNVATTPTSRSRRVRDEPVEPIVGDLGIAMQQHDVAVAMQVEAAIDGGGESVAHRLLEQRDAQRLQISRSSVGGRARRR